MINKNFDAEESIKKWANAISLIGEIIMYASGLAAFIVLCCDFEYLWWVSLIILGGGGLILLSTLFTSAMIWGFGEVVGDIRRISTRTVTEIPQNDDVELPEL